MSFIIVNIPHQGRVTAWVAREEQDIIKMAYKVEDMAYEEWTLDRALDCFGEREEIPQELLEILDAEGKALEFAFNGGCHSEWLKIGDAPSELEAAKEALFHDLSTGLVLSEEEARRFVSGNNDIYSGHQCIKAQGAVDNILSDYFDN